MPPPPPHQPGSLAWTRIRGAHNIETLDFLINQPWSGFLSTGVSYADRLIAQVSTSTLLKSSTAPSGFNPTSSPPLPSPISARTLPLGPRSPSFLRSPGNPRSKAQQRAHEERMARLQKSLWLLFPLALISLIAFSPSPTLASSGDRHPAFQHCLSKCVNDRCLQEGGPPPLPLALRMTLWDCPADCKYHCSHAFTTSLAAEEGYHQFYGKWAFWRLGGIQEPASVLFSIGNWMIHYQGYKKMRRRVPKACGLRKWMMGLAVVQMNTWVWSALFHTRDLPFTELMDYFSATATILYTCHYTLIRLFHLFPQYPTRPKPITPGLVLHTVFILAYISHITYLLSTPRFDYGWNIAFNTSVGALHLFMWTCFSLSFQFRLPFPLSRIPSPYPPLDPLKIKNKPKYSYRTAALVLTTTAAMSFELLDFAPIRRTIDAHSLWHAATIVIARGWYDFMLKDAEELEAARTGSDGVRLGMVDKRRTV